MPRSNTIYNQKASVLCMGCAIGNLYEATTKKTPPSLKTILEWYMDRGWVDEQGLPKGNARPNLSTFLRFLKTHPLGDVKVKSAKLVRNIDELMKYKYFIVSFKGTPKIDEKGAITAKNNIGRHAMLGKRYSHAKKGIEMENSWGVEWGLGGRGVLKDFSLIQEGWIVDFEI